MLLTKDLLLASCVLALGLSPGAQTAAAQEEKVAAQDPADTQQRQETRRRMLDRWGMMRGLRRVGEKEQEIARLEDPVFSYAEPTRETGGIGTMWVFGKEGRPAALLAQSKADGRAVWGYELAALEEGVSVVMHDGWKWTPKSALNMTPFESGPRPADSAVRRLSQMKSLVERFSLSEEYGGESYELRLLPRPAYRYQDEKVDLIDGALFIFAHGTNPEALAVIECRREMKGPVWSYGFLPLAGAAVTAKLDGKTVWSKEPTRDSRAQEIYSTWLETE
jgi:hypothetical protein